MLREHVRSGPCTQTDAEHTWELREKRWWQELTAILERHQPSEPPASAEYVEEFL